MAEKWKLCIEAPSDSRSPFCVFEDGGDSLVSHRGASSAEGRLKAIQCTGEKVVKAADTVTCVGRQSVEVVMCMKHQDRI